MTNNEVTINDLEYDNNLLFYTMLKSLLKVQLNDNQLVDLQSLVKNNQNRFNNDLAGFKSLLLENNTIINTEVAKYVDYSFYINLCEEDNYSKWCSLNEAAIELMLMKDLILAESRVYALNKYRELTNDITDQLSFEYDISSLSIPYGQRVMSSLLVFALTTLEREDTLMLSASSQSINNINELIEKIKEDYAINSNCMFQLVVGESVNQSIKSTAGSSYEARVSSTLQAIVDVLYNHSHDSKISSVEYDNTFEIDGIKFGVSAKRTLRERYKQNFEDTDLLDVDYMFLITLGIDLTREKVNNILQKKGLFIIVSSEIYESKDYLRNNPKVISSEELTREKILETIQAE